MTRAGQIRLAAWLWVALAFVVWNVIFDRVLVVAGRRYSAEAHGAFLSGQPYLHIGDVMRPAAAYGVKVASLVAAAIAIGGLLAVRFAARRSDRDQDRT